MSGKADTITEIQDQFLGALSDAAGRRILNQLTWADLLDLENALRQRFTEFRESCAQIAAQQDWYGASYIAQEIRKVSLDDDDEEVLK